MLEVAQYCNPAAMERNRKRDRDPWREGFAGPCILCNAPVKNGSGVMVHLHCGGGSLVTEEEAKTLDPAADLGGYPIGPECYRRHKAALQPYVDDFAAHAWTT